MYISLGGISIGQEFMKLGLIDEYWLAIHPVLIGKGKRLFERLDKRANLKLADTKRSGQELLYFTI